MTVPTSPRPPVVAPVNAEQASAWNGEEGEDWAANADRFDAASRRYDAPLVAGAELGPTDRVLDVGCGAGRSTRNAAAIAVSGHATGIDLSAPMLAEARRRSEAAGLTNTTYVQGDAQVHPFAPGEFDVVISRFGAQFFGDPVAAFTNIGHGLRPGGRLALMAWQALDANEWLLVLRRTLAAGRTLPVPPNDAAGPFGLSDPERVHRILTAAGFVDVHLTAVREPVWLGADADDAYGFLTGLGLTRGLLDGLEDSTRDAALAALREELAAHVTAEGVLLGASAWLITAHRA